jgi:hypothetical protein
MHTLKVIVVAAMFGSFSGYVKGVPAAPITMTPPTSVCTQWEVNVVFLPNAPAPMTLDPGWEPFAGDGFNGSPLLVRHCLN